MPDPRLDAFAASQLEVAEMFGKANRKSHEGTRLLADVHPDPAALAVYSSDPAKAGRQSMYNVLYAYVSTTPVQCSLCTLVAMAKGLDGLDPSHFIPLSAAMDDDSAQEIARSFLRYRTEKEFDGTIAPLWNNDPGRLRIALVSVFELWGQLFLADPSISRELSAITGRIYKIARDIPDWNVANNSYFWKIVLDQVRDILDTAGRSCTTAADLVERLRHVPDFASRHNAKARLDILYSTAQHKLIQQTASQTIVANAPYTSDATGRHLAPRVPQPPEEVVDSDIESSADSAASSSYGSDTDPLAGPDDDASVGSASDSAVSSDDDPPGGSDDDN